MFRWLKRIGIGITALVLVAGLFSFDFVRSFQYSLPVYDGTVAVTALDSPIQIVRDNHAVPHILAGSFRDAAYGLGYAHAQDRLWQMEMARRFIQGRLAELFGATAVGTDATMRTMGLYTAAEDAVEHLTPEAQQILLAYAEGVNAYIANHKGRWPIEFVLAGDTAPDLWRPADSIAVLKGMAYQLSGNAYGEAARAQLTGILGRKSVQDFFLPFSDAPLPAYLDEIYGTTRTGQAFAVPDTTASDNWVVDGTHSVTGKPLLANDPHLGFSIPSVWYLAHLSYPDDDIAGATLAGIPAIIGGHNRHVAWGMTNTGPDTQDLYLERINPDNKQQYQLPGGRFANFDVRVETIKVRFGADRHVSVRTSRHGPVMSDVVGTSFAHAAPAGYALALAWTALQPDDTSYEAVLAIDRAKDASGFKAGAARFVTPMQNLVYADDSGETGHIGLILPGRVPMRAENNDSLGLVPAPGWDGRYDWQGYVPSADAVSIVDPPSGRIATANNKTAPDDYPYTLTREWDAPYRYDRIETLLAKTPKQSVESFKAIQTDKVDTYAQALKLRLLKAAPFSEADVAAAHLVDAWNGTMLDTDSAPLIWAAWTRALARRIYADELGANFVAYWGYRSEFTLRVLDNVDDQARWCADRATPEIEDCDSRIRLALHDAVTELTQAYGAGPNKWRWGDAHKAMHQAQPFGMFPIIGKYFNREIEMDGGPFTLLRADNAMNSATPYAAIHGAGYRGIYDLADPDRSQFIISTGQSGNLFSPHYDDLLHLWARGEYIAIPTKPDPVAKAAVNRLVLQPMTSTVP